MFGSKRQNGIFRSYSAEVVTGSAAVPTSNSRMACIWLRAKSTEIFTTQCLFRHAIPSYQGTVLSASLCRINDGSILFTRFPFPFTNRFHLSGMYAIVQLSIWAIDMRESEVDTHKSRLDFFSVGVVAGGSEQENRSGRKQSLIFLRLLDEPL